MSVTAQTYFDAFVKGRTQTTKKGNVSSDSNKRFGAANSQCILGYSRIAQRIITFRTVIASCKECQEVGMGVLEVIDIGSVRVIEVEGATPRVRVQPSTSIVGRLEDVISNWGGVHDSFLWFTRVLHIKECNLGFTSMSAVVLVGCDIIHEFTGYRSSNMSACHTERQRSTVVKVTRQIHHLRYCTVR